MLIVIKEKNRVYMATTAYDLKYGLSRKDTLHEENLPLWRAKNIPGCLMATSRCDMMGVDLLRYGDLHLRAALTPNNLIKKIVPAIHDQLEKFDQLDDKERNRFCIFLAKKDKAFFLSKIFCYIEVEESMAFGAFDDIARGALLSTKGLPPLERIKAVCHVLERTTGHKQFPAVVMNTAEEERVVLYEE